jgi:hypothetical protein
LLRPKGKSLRLAVFGSTMRLCGLGEGRGKAQRWCLHRRHSR